MNSAGLSVKGVSLDLHPLRSLFLKEERTLVVSDLHLGKAGHFRKHGIAISKKVHLHDLFNLKWLLQEIQPEKVFFLGDLFHSDQNMEWQDFIDFLASYRHIDFTLIEGNHDILSRYPESLTVVKRVEIPPFSFTHFREKDDLYNISGHIHPGVTIRGRARQGITMPCFLFSNDHCVMPAFGQFTGIKKVRPKQDDRVFAIVEEQVIELV
ncbi:MAG: ligase-associated DNA damage response endonuclease PdeM [Bacteroidota bacterium]